MSFRFSEVAVCRKTEAELFDCNNPKSQIVRGDLSVLVQMSTGMLLFRMGQFSYGINPNDTVIYEDKDKQYKLLLCFQMSQQKNWVLKINQNVQLIFFVIGQRCKLIHRNASRILLKQINEQTSKKGQKKYSDPIVEANYEKFKNLQITQSQQNAYQNMTTSMMLVDASKSLSKGLAKAGEFIAIGLQRLGAFLSKKVDPAQQIVISEQTKKLLKDSNDGSKKILQITVQQFSAFFRIARKQTQKLVDKFQKSEKGKQLIQKGDYTNYKKKLLTGIHIVANLYEGVTQGLSQAATGLTKGTAEVVGVRYGKDAGQATLNIAQGVRNVYKITQAPYNTATKQFNPTQAVIKKL